MSTGLEKQPKHLSRDNWFWRTSSRWSIKTILYWFWQWGRVYFLKTIIVHVCWALTVCRYRPKHCVNNLKWHWDHSISQMKKLRPRDPFSFIPSLNSLQNNMHSITCWPPMSHGDNELILSGSINVFLWLIFSRCVQLPVFFRKARKKLVLLPLASTRGSLEDPMWCSVTRSIAMLVYIPLNMT